MKQTFEQAFQETVLRVKRRTERMHFLGMTKQEKEDLERRRAEFERIKHTLPTSSLGA